MSTPLAPALERPDVPAEPQAEDKSVPARLGSLTVRRLILTLLALPLLYVLVAYIYLATWHGKAWLLGTLVHENGRLTLGGSLFYFDHFLACVPMIVLFALCAAGAFALGRPALGDVDPARARYLALNLLVPVPIYLCVMFLASVQVAGWQRTLDYSLQSIERDGVLSPGGSWNQLQLSNIPIALGTIAAAFALGRSWSATRNPSSRPLTRAGGAYVLIAFAFAIGLSLLWWPGWEAFLNPRWLAHSVREHATYPLTAVPIALACILGTHAYVTRQQTGSTAIRPRLPLPALVVLGLGILLLTAQLLILRQTNVLAIAQKPSFAPEGLSVGYLLASHVFEHFLDFVFIAPLCAGLYALLVWLAAPRVRCG
jgi:hypothetical protein